jgi:hypothetical protein
MKPFSNGALSGYHQVGGAVEQAAVLSRKVYVEVVTTQLATVTAPWPNRRK